MEYKFYSEDSGVYDICYCKINILEKLWEFFEETKFVYLFKSSVSKIEYIKGGPRDIGAVFRVIKKFKAIFKIKYFLVK